MPKERESSIYGHKNHNYVKLEDSQMCGMGVMALMLYMLMDVRQIVGYAKIIDFRLSKNHLRLKKTSHSTHLGVFLTTSSISERRSWMGQAWSSLGNYDRSTDDIRDVDKKWTLVTWSSGHLEVIWVWFVHTLWTIATDHNTTDHNTTYRDCVLLL